ncbi:transposable element Tcb2 transposase [Trichonephila clavipes]|nr:transposable element Tcb2 transposase [Trichonephila clavipes]
MNQASICETMLAAIVLDAMTVKAAFQSALSNDIVYRYKGGATHSLRNTGVISIATATFVKCYSPKSYPSFKASLKLSISRIIYVLHVAQTVRDFCLAQHMQLLPWPAHSPDMPPIEHVGDLVGRRFARDPRPAASKDDLLILDVRFPKQKRRRVIFQREDRVRLTSERVVWLTIISQLLERLP